MYLIFVFPIGKQNSELVTENYYEDELSYQKVIDAKNNAATLTAKPQYAQLPYGIRIAFPKDINNENANGEYSGSQNHFRQIPDYVLETMKKYIQKLEEEILAESYDADPTERLKTCSLLMLFGERKLKVKS